MKKLLFILVIGLTSCHINTEDDGTTKSGELEFEIIKIDGCQYLYRSIGDTRLFTHKGDCDNSIHAPIVMYSDTTLADQLEEIK